MADSTPVPGDPFRAMPEFQKYRPRACQSCARSKMRCVWPSEPGATPCERCVKIKALCTLPEVNPRRKRGPSTRVGQLEEKIDGIMSLLNASQQIQQNSPSPGRGQTPPGSFASAPLYEQQIKSSIQQLLNPNADAAAAASGTSARSTSTPTPSDVANLHSTARFVPPPGLASSTSDDIVTRPESDRPASSAAAASASAVEFVDIAPGFRVTYHEADRALNLFRSVYAPYFPFVTIPVMLGAVELHESAPFLFRTVVSVAAPQGPAVQAQFRAWFRDYVAQHVVVNNERRLEILQAILIHLAWGDYHFLVESQATNLVQLAGSLVIDLGLNRWPSDHSKPSFLMAKDAARRSGVMGATLGLWKRKHDLDEMRAALGTFYVNSLCSALCRRHNPMAYNSYLRRCCETIEQAQEYDSDRFLVALVKMHHILNRAADLVPYSDDEAERRVDYAPIHVALTSIHKELDALVRQQPPEVECNALLWTHYHAIICRLYEPVIYIRPQPSTDAYYPHSGTWRTAALWTSLHAARDLLAAHLVPAVHTHAPFYGLHLSFAVVTAARLLLLHDDDTWDPALAHDALDLGAACTRFADEAKASSGEERMVMAAWRDKMRWVADWYVARREGAGSRAPADRDEAGVPGELDESFWRVMCDWDWNPNGGTVEMADVQS